MALVTYCGDAPVLENLLSQFASLDSEFNLIQISHQRFCQIHQTKCSIALSEATTSLLDIVRYVSKADKALIYWYEKGTAMKTALQLVGMDKRTGSIIEKRSKKIKTKTATTEAQFTRTSEVFMDGLKTVQTLDKQINLYSISRLGSARAQASGAHNQADMDAKLAELSLEKSKVEQSTVQSELKDISSQINSVGTQRQTAQAMSDTTGAVACGSGAVAAVAGVASFFFPPIAFVALPAAGLAASNTVASCVYDTQADNLRARETQLVSQMTSLKSQIESLELTIPELDKKRASYIQTKTLVFELTSRGETLQKESQVVLERLLDARILLSSLQMKIRSVAITLSECGYLETRREIAMTLREIVNDLDNRSSGTAIVLSKSQSGVMARILGKLSKVESRTANVALIMETSR